MKAALDHEDKDTYMVTVTATDPGGLSATVNVTIKVTDVDERPVIMLGGLAISGRASVDYAEDRTDAVGTYMPVGPDAASATWSLSGDDAGDFMISSGGELAFRTDPDFERPSDADGDNVYEVTVVANDGTNEASQSVTITVTDKDEPADTLLTRYDADNSGQIEKEEARAAVTDYFDGVIDKEEARAVITLYFQAGSSG